MLTFLSVPAAIREQIYTELLALSRTTPAAEQAPLTTLGKLLLVNRQCYREVSNYMRAQLCTLIKTNDPSFAKQLVENSKQLPLMLELYPAGSGQQEQATDNLISMEIDFYVYTSGLKAASFPVFVVAASAFQDLQRILLWTDCAMWIIRTSISFKIINTLPHTKEDALSKLVQPWLQHSFPASFLGAITNPAIPPALSSQLKEKLSGDFAATGHLQKIQSLVRSEFYRAQAGDWTGAAEICQMNMQYVWLVWDCQLESLRKETRSMSRFRVEGDFMMHLWTMTAHVAANCVANLLRAASKSEVSIRQLSIPPNSGDKVEFAKARELAEQTILFLRLRPASNSGALPEEANSRIRKSKAKMSLRAHLACKRLGDLAAAIGYLEEAKMYEPEKTSELDEEILALRSEMNKASEIRQPVILWNL